MVKYHISLYLCISYASILVRIFPCIDISGSVLSDQAVFLLRVHERNKSFILFRLIIHKGKYTARSGKAHNGTVHLLGRLGYGIGKLSYKPEE